MNAAQNKITVWGMSLLCYIINFSKSLCLFTNWDGGGGGERKAKARDSVSSLSLSYKK